MSSLSVYLDVKRRLLAHDYQANCLAIARDIARLLVDDGRHPFIACLHKEEVREGKRFHYPLIPRKYAARFTWTKHYVCCCEGMVYDPMLEEPVRIEQYSTAVFGEDFPMERITLEEADTLKPWKSRVKASVQYSNLVFLALMFLAIPLGKSFARQAPQHKAGDIVIEESEAQAPGTGEKVPVDFCTLYVPENRSNPNGKLIEIVFLRFKSTSKNPGLPTIYLEGGPGVSGINSALGNMFHLFMALRDTGDVVVPDQRGSGRSNRLTCPGSTQDLLGVSLKRDAFFRQLEQEARGCVQTLSAKGVDLSAYNTNENADDIDALRKALGAPKANLLAYSYGTHLASAIIKRHQNNFQRAVMLGTVGPDQLQKLPRGIQKQLAEIGRLVRLEASLNEKIPNLLLLIDTVLSKLDKQPVVVEVINPKDKRKTNVTVDKFAMQWLTAAFISRRDFIAALPALYYSLSKDDLSLLTAILSSVAQRTALPATQTTMRCASNVSKERQKQIEREAKGATLGDAVNFPIPEICSVWGITDLGDSFRAPVKSRMPILFISGSLDANAPPDNVEEMRKFLPNSSHLMLEGAEHEDWFLASPLREQVRERVVGFMKGDTSANSRMEAPPIRFVPIKE